MNRTQEFLQKRSKVNKEEIKAVYLKKEIFHRIQVLLFGMARTATHSKSGSFHGGGGGGFTREFHRKARCTTRATLR